MKRQLYKQPTFFGEVESCNVTADYLLYAEELITEWKNKGEISFESQEDFNKAVIACANGFTPMFDEECAKRNMNEPEKERARRFLTRVLGNPRSISQESFSREWRKIRQK